MISRCSEARERTMNWSEWSSETRTDTNERYLRTPVTSIDATRTVFSIATAGNCTRTDYLRTTTDRIVSWSRINGKLTRIAWRSNKSILEHESKTVVGLTAIDCNTRAASWRFSESRDDGRIRYGGAPSSAEVTISPVPFLRQG